MRMDRDLTHSKLISPSSIIWAVKFCSWEDYRRSFCPDVNERRCMVTSNKSRSSPVWGNFEGKGLPTVSCARTAEPIEMPFWTWTAVGPRKRVLDMGCTATWRT